jgi:precorrin-6B methylase 2
MVQSLGALRVIEGKISELTKASSQAVQIGGSTALTNIISKTVDLEARVWNRFY